MKKEIKLTIEYNGGKAIHTFSAKGDKAIMEQAMDYLDEFKRQCKSKEPELLRMNELMQGCVEKKLKLVAPHNNYTHWASAQIDGYDVQLFAQEGE